MTTNEPRNPEPATVIGERIRQVLAAPLTSDDVLDPDRELDRVLATVGLTAASRPVGR